MINFKCIFVVITLSLSGFTQADTSTTKVENDVLSSFQSLVDASKKLDAKSYFEHFDVDKFVGLNSDGTNWNSFSQLVPIINSGFGAIKEVISLEFPNVKVSVIDEHTAILVNEFTQSMLLKNGATISISGGGTQVWSKRSGRWKLVSVSASSKPNACKS